MDSVEKGIVQIISEHNIKWLVMGAEANISFKSNQQENPSASCQCNSLSLHSHLASWNYEEEKGVIGGCNKEGILCEMREFYPVSVAFYLREATDYLSWIMFLICSFLLNFISPAIL